MTLILISFITKTDVSCFYFRYALLEVFKNPKLGFGVGFRSWNFLVL